MALTPSSSDFQSPMFSSPSFSTPSKRGYRKDRMKIISQITILDGTMDGKILVSLKIDDCSFVDEQSLALLSMPDGPFMTSEPIKPSFHPFVITVQSGQRIYGGSYIFGLKQIARSQDSEDEHKIIYISRALVALTIRPLVNQLQKLLEWCVNEGGCNPRWLRCLANIRLPQKGRAIIIDLPDLKNKRKSIETDPPEKIVTENLIDAVNDCFKNMNSVSIYRPASVFPLFDYSFRLLFTEILTVENFLLLFCCALNELQILIVSHSYYNLMLIAECLIALLNPFKWQHVYVPILPSKLGLHYLDAPTPFIMGINSRLRNMIKPNKISCFVDCDNFKVELSNIDGNHHQLLLPPFIDELRQELQNFLNNNLKFPQDKSDTVSDLTEKFSSVFDESFSSLDEVTLNQSVRVLFFNKLKKCILHKYQQYILPISDTKDQVKFDAVSFLSDQPLSMRPFLQNFVETQMFASFIDEAGKNMLNKRQKGNEYSEQMQQMNSFSDSYFFFDDGGDEDNEELSSFDYWQSLIEARFKMAQSINLIDLEDVNQSFVTTASAIPMSPYRRRPQPNVLIRNQQQAKISAPSSPSKQVPIALTAPTNWKVVETLLKEVKTKTKRILLAKMNSEEIVGSTISPSMSGKMEENTLITSLCDLIERIWSHAQTLENQSLPNSNNNQTNRCAFWFHLTAFHRAQVNSSNNHLNNSDNSNRGESDDSDQQSDQEQSSGGWISLKKRIDSFSNLTLEQNGLRSRRSFRSAFTKSLPTSLLYDFTSINKMTDIKTEVGKSRAFIRLSLERKLLSKHLRALLQNQELLQSLYKRYAFLRCEDEREQFLTLLLTLNAVDLNCFTNTFTTSLLPYTLIICANSSSFNGSVSITGSSNKTNEPIFLDSTQCPFRHKNFCHVHYMSLRINPNQKLFVEQCFLRNNVTNALYRFDCGKWFGKNIDDGSTERLLMVEQVSGTINDYLKRSNHTRSSSIGRNWSSTSTTTATSNTKDYNDKYSVDDLQAMLSESINQIMKFFLNEKVKQQQLVPNNNVMDIQSKLNKSNFYNGKVSNSSTLSKIHSRGRQHSFSNNCPNLVNLFFGQRKFLWIMTQIFYYGFKNRRSFRRQTYIWDYLLRVQCELKHISPLDWKNDHNQSTMAQDFVNLIDKITNKLPTYGKDTKFQMFIFIALREKKLVPHYFKVLRRPHLLQAQYDSESFLRDTSLFEFLHEILKTFNEVDLKMNCLDVTRNL